MHLPYSVNFRAPLKALAFATACSWVAHASGADTPPRATPPGEAKTAKTRTLEAGAKLLQNNGPLAPMDIYLDGFHPMKDDPEHQMEAHHFCRQVNQDFAQCALFDGKDRNANLTGIEYIISEKLFQTLPEGEKQFWHPHNGEILSGQLIAPGIPQVAEKQLMKDKLNSYGKTWHLWNTGTPGKPGDALPLGPPMLAWSFSRDGEIQPDLLADRDRRLGTDTAKRRRQRTDLQPLARPQMGVDALKGRYARPTTNIPGVIDKASAPLTNPAPTRDAQ
jgi:hypothetical protein